MGIEKPMDAIPVKAVIIAGGSGTRLWPLSRQQLPKQFLSLDGNEGLLEATVSRLNPVISPDDVLIVTNESYALGEAYQALACYNKVLEPVGRNTAPAIALAAAYARFIDKTDPVLVVLPADHMIGKVSVFHEALNKAIELAKSGLSVTFGIEPSHPETGFGYIKAFDQTDAQGIQYVERFVEKPDLETAREYLDEGHYYWNSGMFVWRASTILNAINEYLPEIQLVLEKVIHDWEQGENPQKVINRYFESMPDISIDYGVLEKIAGDSKKLAVVPCDIDWSDVGSWDAVHDILPKDSDDNASVGRAMLIGCQNTLIHSHNRLVTAVGVENLRVVETADAIMIAPAGQTQRVREIVDELKHGDGQEHILSLTVRRPWGSYTVLEEQPGFKMKRIVVAPGSSLSLQRHQHRSEHWVVVSGTATVTRGEEVITVAKNESTYIPIGTKHRLENKGKIPLTIVEIQVGDYLEEDDIERFDDVYGRSEQ